LRMPRDSCCPSPSTSKRPPGNSSATTATTLVVPISSATIRSLMSRVIVLLAVSRRYGGQRDREPVRVTYIGGGDGAVAQAGRELRPGMYKPPDPGGERQRAGPAMRVGDSGGRIPAQLEPH